MQNVPTASSLEYYRPDKGELAESVQDLSHEARAVYLYSITGRQLNLLYKLTGIGAKISCTWHRRASGSRCNETEEGFDFSG